MTHPTITIGSTSYLHTEPVLRHRIPTARFTYRCETVKNIDECTLRTMAGDFDLGEMSLATFFKMKERGAEFKGLPIFSKKFVPQYAFCAEAATLTGPQDLRGRRVAVFQYWVTASLWHRWLLKHYYQVDPAEITWCPLRRDRMEDMPYPAGYRFDWQHVGQSPAPLLRAGQVDCFFYARRPDDFNGLRYLVRDGVAEGRRYLKTMRLMPITHVMAVKPQLLEEHPWLGAELVRLFDAARLRVQKEVGHISSQYLPFADLQQREIDALLGADWNAYGWAANEGTIATFYDAACEQGFVPSGLDWRSWFVPVE